MRVRIGMEKQTPTSKEVEDALQQVITSQRFATSPSLSKFLSYVVNEKLGGREDGIKAYSIAVDALDRPEDFDPQIDPSVRVLAGRLRTALTEYYDDEGANDATIIDVPTGGYKPNFSNNSAAGTQNASIGGASDTDITSPVRQNSRLIYILIALLVLGAIGYFLFSQFNPAKTTPNSNAITLIIDPSAARTQNIGAATKTVRLLRDLRAELSRNESISVITAGSAEAQGADDQIDFKIGGFIDPSNSGERFTVELTNSRTNKIVWARGYELTEGEGTIVTSISRELNTQIFGASIKALEGRDPNKLTAAQLFVLATWVPGPSKSTLAWEKERVELAKLAVVKDPNFGPAHSVLSDKLAYLSAVDGPSNTPGILDEAKSHAAKARQFSPSDSIAVFNTAQSQWHSGKLSEAIVSMGRVVELNPSFALADFFGKVIPYSCYAAPDDVLASAIAFDRGLAPDNPVRWVTLTWIGWLHLNRDELDLALDVERRAAQIFEIPYTFMRHAAILNEMGRTDAALSLLKAHQDAWPNLDPAHFAEVTYPRLCEGEPRAEKMLNVYRRLAKTAAPIVRE